MNGLEGKKAGEHPDGISVLFVDDDAMLRKLFMRAVKRVALPSWTIEDASSGEMALKVCESNQSNMVFMDQYVASTPSSYWGLGQRKP